MNRSDRLYVVKDFTQYSAYVTPKENSMKMRDREGIRYGAHQTSIKMDRSGHGGILILPPNGDTFTGLSIHTHSRIGRLIGTWTQNDGNWL